jgi:hypothetical protein
LQNSTTLLRSEWAGGNKLLRSQRIHHQLLTNIYECELFDEKIRGKNSTTVPLRGKFFVNKNVLP